MRAVVQRVTRAHVTVGGERTGEIARGLVVLIGAVSDDTHDDAQQLVDKLVGLRIFPDEKDGAGGHMNLSVTDVGGALLLVSQFTLLGDARKGRRPSFIQAMAPGPAEALYEHVVLRARATGLAVATGRFRADMQVELVNDGPVTILLDTKKLF
ncbi:MAG: D-aminoacyl-tRNA deacylase [Polyangia bacterium]